MFSNYGPLKNATRKADIAIERIAAEHVRRGVPLWDAVEKARKEYQRQVAAEEKMTTKTAVGRTRRKQHDRTHNDRTHTIEG